jgi:hypothetical protein
MAYKVRANLRIKAYFAEKLVAIKKSNGQTQLDPRTERAVEEKDYGPGRAKFTVKTILIRSHGCTSTAKS